MNKLYFYIGASVSLFICVGAVYADDVFSDVQFSQEEKVQDTGKYEYIEKTDWGDGFFEVHEYTAPEGVGYIMYIYNSQNTLIEIRGNGPLSNTLVHTIKEEVSSSTEKYEITTP